MSNISVAEAGRRGGKARARNLSKSELKRQARIAGIASGLSRKKAAKRTKPIEPDGAHSEAEKKN